MSSKKITELVKTTNVENTDLLLLETSTGTRSITYDNLKTSINEGANEGVVAGASKEIYDDRSVNMGRKTNTTVGLRSLAFGEDVEASASFSHAEGYSTCATGRWGSHAEGQYSAAEGDYSHAEGGSTIASGTCSHAEGGFTTASGTYCHAEGYHTTSYGYAAVACGRYNKPMDANIGGAVTLQLGDAFVFGNGTSETNLSNALRITFKGDVLGTQAFQSSGADYAEFIKPWADGNKDAEDRIGYFVTVKDGFLYKAEPNDYIVGITSGNPSVVGNADEDYYWRYERDEFNRIVMEDVPEMVQKVDNNGNPIYDEETHEPVMVETGNIIKDARMKLADNYDSSKQNSYIPRAERNEWDYVGMCGVLPVRDDGTCLPNHFCKCGENGIATLATERGFDTFYVIERLSDNIVSVICK